MSKPKTKRFRYQTLFQRIGEVTVTWAYLEFAVDNVIGVLHTKWGGQKEGYEIPKTSFSRKLEYLRTWYAGDYRWPVVFPNFLDVIAMLDAASESRHRIIHGVATDIRAFPATGKNEVARILRKRDAVSVETVHYTLTTIRKFRDHIFALTVFMGHFLEIIDDDPILKNEPNKSLGELFRKLGGFFPVRERRRNVPKNGT